MISWGRIPLCFFINIIINSRFVNSKYIWHIGKAYKGFRKISAGSFTIIRKKEKDLLYGKICWKKDWFEVEFPAAPP